jgi:hypothetical protein
LTTADTLFMPRAVGLVVDADLQAKPKTKLSLVKPKKATALKQKVVAKAKKETSPKKKQEQRRILSTLL